MGYVTKITSDAAYLYIRTSLPYTNMPLWMTAANFIVVKQGVLRVINCTGCDNIEMASDAERQGLSEWEFQRF